MLEWIARTTRDAEPMEGMAQRAIQSIDRSVARFSVTTVEQQVSEQTVERRFQTTLISNRAVWTSFQPFRRDLSFT